MQNIENFQELSDQDLETVVGGKNHFASTSASAVVAAYASGGQFGIDEALAQTKSISWTNKNGSSVSIAYGVAIAFGF